MSNGIGLVRRILGMGTHAAEETLRFDYQPEGDLLFAWLGEPQAAKNIEVEPGVYVRVAETKRVIGIEILDCAARYDVSPKAITAAFVEDKIRKYSQPALARFA
jgi:uncharacterized protein YuzE